MAQVEIISILGSLFLLAIIVELIRRRQLAEGYSLLWLLTVTILMILSIWREMLDILAGVMGIFYPPAALFVVGFGFLLLILLQFSAVISKLAKHNKDLAHQVALLNWKLDSLQKKMNSDESN